MKHKFIYLILLFVLFELTQCFSNPFSKIGEPKKTFHGILTIPNIEQQEIIIGILKKRLSASKLKLSRITPLSQNQLDVQILNVTSLENIPMLLTEIGHLDFYLELDPSQKMALTPIFKKLNLDSFFMSDMGQNKRFSLKTQEAKSLCQTLNSEEAITRYPLPVSLKLDLY